MTRKRAPKSAPMARIHYDLPNAESGDILASLRFGMDYAEAKAAIDQLRGRSEGDDAEMLARLLAYNLAVQAGTARGKLDGVKTRQAKAAAHEREIAQQLQEQGATVKAVSIDRQASGDKAASERTVQRVKRKLAP